MAIILQAQVDPRTGLTLSAQHLRVLLFAPSSLADTQIQATIEKIRHFAYLSDEPNVIVFLLQPPRDTRFQSSKTLMQDTDATSDIDTSRDTNIEGLLAYSQLQAELMNHADIPNIPILPLVNLDSLPALLQKHADKLKVPRRPGRAAATSIDLLKMCTLSQPMPQHTAHVFSDMFDNFKDVATAMTADQILLGHSSSPNASCVAQGMGDDGSTGGSDERGAVNKLKMMRDLIGEQEMGDLQDFWMNEYQV